MQNKNHDRLAIVVSLWFSCAAIYRQFRYALRKFPPLRNHQTLHHQTLAYSNAYQSNQPGSFVRPQSPAFLSYQPGNVQYFQISNCYPLKNTVGESLQCTSTLAGVSFH